MADICYFEDQKKWHLRKPPLKVRKNIYYNKVLVSKYVKNTLLVADLGSFFPYYYKVNIWKGHLRLKLKNVTFSSRWPILGEDIPLIS